MAAGGFIATKTFNVSGNAFGASPLPGEWYSATLLSMDVAYTGLSGLLPVEWGEPVAGQASHFPALQLLYIQGNNLSGARRGGRDHRALCGCYRDGGRLAVGRAGERRGGWRRAGEAGGRDGGGWSAVVARVWRKRNAACNR